MSSSPEQDIRWLSEREISPKPTQAAGRDFIVPRALGMVPRPQLDRSDAMILANLDFKQEPYIAQMWAYAKSSTRTTQRTGQNLLSIEARLQAARNCSDDWLESWARAVQLSDADAREVHAAVVDELEQLVHVYRDLAG
jgi:hypothetical protein